MSEEEFFNRAINRICKDYDYNFANEFKLLFLKKDKEIERLHSIIKEVREYIENNKIYTNEKQEAYTLKNTWYGIELLGILDKENK